MKILLTTKNIDSFLDQSRRYWLETDKSVKPTGETQHLTDRQFTALAHLQAAADLFYQSGLFSEGLEISLDYGSSEPDTED